MGILSLAILERLDFVVLFDVLLFLAEGNGGFAPSPKPIEHKEEEDAHCCARNHLHQGVVVEL